MMRVTLYSKGGRVLMYETLPDEEASSLVYQLHNRHYSKPNAALDADTDNVCMACDAEFFGAIVAVKVR